MKIRMNENAYKAEARRNNADLSKVSGTIANVIANNLNEFNEKSNDKSMPLAEYKAYILDLVNQADHNKSQQEAIARIQRMRSKYEIMSYVYGIYLKGKDENLGAIR